MKTHLVTYHHGTVGKETSEQHRFMELDPAKPLMPQIRQALPTSLSERLLVTRVLDMEGKPVAIRACPEPVAEPPVREEAPDRLKAFLKSVLELVQSQATSGQPTNDNRLEAALADHREQRTRESLLRVCAVFTRHHYTVPLGDDSDEAEFLLRYCANATLPQATAVERWRMFKDAPSRFHLLVSLIQEQAQYDKQEVVLPAWLVSTYKALRANVLRPDAAVATRQDFLGATMDWLASPGEDRLVAAVTTGLRMQFGLRMPTQKEWWAAVSAVDASLRQKNGPDGPRGAIQWAALQYAAHDSEGDRGQLLIRLMAALAPSGTVAQADEVKEALRQTLAFKPQEPDAEAPCKEAPAWTEGVSEELVRQGLDTYWSRNKRFEHLRSAMRTLRPSVASDLNDAIARTLLLIHGKEVVGDSTRLAELDQACRGRRVDDEELKTLVTRLDVMGEAALPDLLLHLAARRSLL